MNKLVPLLLDGTVFQHTGVDGFDEGGLDCGNVDLALASAITRSVALGGQIPIDKKRGLLQVVATRTLVE